jgi:hypothetical protein
MDNEIRVQRSALHILIPLENFKVILGLDDREATALAEARKWRDQYGNARRRGIMAAVITGVICFTGGIAAGSVLISGGK